MTPMLMTGVALQTVVETPPYLVRPWRSIRRSPYHGRQHGAENPEAGVPLGGGIRKARIALPGRGRRGGARVELLFAGDKLPVFLLTVFAKNENASLSVEERRALIQAAKSVIADYRRAS